MSYFAAGLGRGDSGWVGVDLDLDSVESLEELAEEARGQTIDDEEGPVLVLIEQEDEWFGVVRADPDEDPKVFVSDAAAALRHALGEILLPGFAEAPAELALLVADGPVLVTAPPDSDRAAIDYDDFDESTGASSAAADEDEPPTLHLRGPAGDDDLLADLGISPGSLRALAERDGLTPAVAITSLAEDLGCDDVLESVR